MASSRTHPRRGPPIHRRVHPRTLAAGEMFFFGYQALAAAIFLGPTFITPDSAATSNVRIIDCSGAGGSVRGRRSIAHGRRPCAPTRRGLAHCRVEPLVLRRSPTGRPATAPTCVSRSPTRRSSCSAAIRYYEAPTCMEPGRRFKDGDRYPHGRCLAPRGPALAYAPRDHGVDRRHGTTALSVLRGRRAATTRPASGERRREGIKHPEVNRRRRNEKSEGPHRLAKNKLFSNRHVAAETSCGPWLLAHRGAPFGAYGFIVPRVRMGAIAQRGRSRKEIVSTRYRVGNIRLASRRERRPRARAVPGKEPPRDAPPSSRRRSGVDGLAPPVWVPNDPD